MNPSDSFAARAEAIATCPFCASGHAHPLEIEADSWVVVCGACGSIGPSAVDKRHAVDRWNLRLASTSGDAAAWLKAAAHS